MCKHCEITFYLFSITQFYLKEDRLAGGDDQVVLTDHLHPWVSELDLRQNGHTFQHTLLTTYKRCGEECRPKLLRDGKLVEIWRSKMESCRLEDKLKEVGTLESFGGR